MAEKKPKKAAKTEKTEKPASAPELPPVQSRAVPQLIKSTKSTKVEPVRPEQLTTAPEINSAALKADQAATESQAKPVTFAHPEPIQSRPPTDEELENLNEHWDDPGDPDGVHAEEQRQRYRDEHPVLAPAVIEQKKHHPWRNAFITLLVIAAATVAVYYLGSYAGDRHNKQTNKPAEQTQTRPTQTAPQTSAPTTKQYSSTNFSLSLSYPTDWKLADNATKLTIASPATQLTLANGTKKSVQVLFTVQHQQSSIAGYPADGATASLASDKLSYTKPTPNQRAQTYVSYLGYTSATALDAMFVTGDNGYLQGQNVPMSDVVEADPLIGIHYVTCESADCTTGTPAQQTLQASAWQSSALSKTVTSLIQSIQLN